MSSVAREVLEARQRNPVGKEIVDDLLYHFPETRGDDRRLYYRFITQVVGVRLSFNDARKLFETFSADTLGRRRRELIEDAIEKGDEASLNYLLPRLGTRHKRVVRARVLRESYGRPRELWSFEVLE